MDEFQKKLPQELKKQNFATTQKKLLQDYEIFFYGIPEETPGKILEKFQEFIVFNT